jgi:large subunit ribosomal protein L5e
MAFIKTVKTTSYYSRYQVKFRRRREGKTDYQARRRLIQQDKNKDDSKKYRLCVRRTNSRIIVQIIYATIQGDRVLAQADSKELKRFGLEAGLTNYAASYATGLLVARRLLKKVGLDGAYAGNTAVEKDYDVSQDEKDRRPFKVILDVGLKATTTGSKVFAALKGVADGGVYIPHSNSRFPGYDSTKPEADNTKLRERVFGVHVDKYLKSLKGTEKQNVQFKRWLETLQKSGAKSIEDLYKKVHAEIRKNPDHVKRGEKQSPKREHTKFVKKRLTNQQRKDNVRRKIEIRQKELAKLAKKQK